jgi:ubiquinone/menaquinone biosynthesis C-methylase UbiE
MAMVGLEPVFQELRIRKVLPYIVPGKVLVDLGCDEEMTLIKRLQPTMKKVIGLDIVTPPVKRGNLEILKTDLTKKFPLKDKTVDVVTMLAVLEHLPTPEKIVTEAYRILKPGGVFLVTVPSQRAEFVLEKILAPVGLVRQDMIDQHENYFTHDRLRLISQQAGFSEVTVESWELGCNTFMKAVR